jgi:2'-5' RNA ligase
MRRASARRDGGRQLTLFEEGLPRGRARATSRLFFALDPPEEVRVALAAVIAGMPPGPSARARRVPAARLHLTLAFLGEMNHRQLEAARAVGGRIAVPGFDLVVDGVGHFADSRVAWLGPAVTPSGLTRLKAELDRELLRFGLPVGQAAFCPHVTALRNVVDQPDVMPFRIEWPVRSFVLMRSPRDASAPCYEPLNCWRLQPV